MKPLRTALTLCSSSYTKLQHTCGSKIFLQKRCKQIVLFQSAVILCVLHAPKNSNIPSVTVFFAKEMQAGWAFSERSRTLCTSCSEKFQYILGDRFFSRKRYKQVVLFQSAVILCVLQALKKCKMRRISFAKKKETP